MHTENMEDQNILVVFTLLHVLLTFTIIPCQGKSMPRKLVRGDVIELEFSNVGAEIHPLARYRRETSNTTDLRFKSENNSTGKLTSSTFIIPDKTHSRALVHWSGQDSHVLFILTREHSPDGFITASTLWRSSDYGTTFKRVDFGAGVILEHIYKSPVNKEQLILSDTTNKKLHITQDEGLTWTPVDVPFHPDSLHLHPTDKDWILAYVYYEMRLYISTDFGKTWSFLQEDVTPWFYWAVPGVDANNYTVHMEITDYRASCKYVTCVAPTCQATVPDRRLGDVYPFSLKVQDQYIFVQKPNLDDAELYVSYRRGPFKKAYFPLDVHPKDFIVMATDENQVLLAVDHKENMASLYLSDVTGQFYVPSLDNVISMVEPGRFDVDFYQVSSLPSTFISNQYTDPDSKDVILERTFISFDRGSNWKMIDAPDKSHCANPEKCHLNLHLKYSQENFGIPNIVTKSNAPGLILAHGTVGASLYDKNTTGVFISTDGGSSWKQTPFHGYYHLNILDQGSVITAILQEENNTKNDMTQTVYYSLDEGSTWTMHQFTDKKMHVDGVLNEPGINTLVVSIFGRVENDGGKQVVKLDFSTVLKTKCLPENYEEWKPLQQRCILGQLLAYERRKQDALCFNGRDFERSVTTTICQCTENDYECDYGYILADKVNKLCTKADWFTDSSIKIDCRDGESYNKSQGYRKVASDKCVGGLENSDKFKKVDATCPILAPNNLRMHTSKAEYATNEKITIHLSQLQGSEYVTEYIWNFGDGKQLINITGLEKAKEINHTYTKAGNYNVTVVAKNSKGMTSSNLVLIIEDIIEDVEITVPWGAQVGKVTQFNATVLGHVRATNFGLVHYVWDFGDGQVPQEPYLTWKSEANHVYKQTGKYKLTVEAVNSVSSTKKTFYLQVYDQLKSVQLRFTANFDTFNSGSYLWRNSASQLLAVDIAKLLYIPTSRLIVSIPPVLPTVADVTILPPENRGLTIKQVLDELEDKVKSQELEFSFLAEDTVKVISVKILHSSDVAPVDNIVTTPVPSHPVVEKSTRSNTAIMISVPVLATLVILVSIGVYLCRKKMKKDQRYSLIMNRSPYDETILEDDFEDELVQGTDDFDSEDGNTNIVINTGRHPTLVMMTGSRNSGSDSAVC